MSLDLGKISGDIEINDEFTKELEKAMGVTIDQIESVRQEMQEAVKVGAAVSEAMDRMGISTEEWNAALARNAALQKEAADQMNTLQAEALKMNSEFDKFAAEMDKAQSEAIKMNQAFDDAANQGGKVEAVFEALAHGSIKDLIGAFVELPAGILIAMEVVVKLIGALGDLGKSVEDLYAHAEKLSNKSLITGFNTTDLQKYSRAAEIAGGDVDRLTTAFNRLQRGAEEGSKAFQKLGISQSQFKAADSAGQLQMVIDKIFSYSTASEQVVAAQAAFGRSGAQLLPTLKAINEGMGETATVIGPEAVKAMAEMDDTLDILKGTWSDLKTQGLAVVALALIDMKPLIEAITAGLKAMIPYVVDLIGFFANMATTIGSNVMNVVKGFTEAITGVVSSGSLAIQTLKGMADGSISVGDGLKTLQIAASQGLGAVNDGMAKANTITFQWKDYAALLAENLKKVDGAAGGVAETISAKFVKAFEKAKDAVEKTWQELDKIQSDAFIKLQSGMMQNTSGSMLGFPSPADLKKETDAMDEALKSATRMAELSGRTNQQTLLNAAIDVTKRDMAKGVDFTTLKNHLVAGLHISDADATKILESLHKGISSPSWGKTFSDSLKGSLANLPSVILGAIQGGGNVGQAIGASLGGDIAGGLGKKAAEAIGGTLGKAVGSIAGPLGSIVGSLVGKGIDKLASAFHIGGNKAIMELNDIRDKFFVAQGGFVELQKKLVGLTSQDLVKKIFDAKTVEEFNSAVNQVNSLLQVQSDAQAGLNDAMDRYGISIEQLGPKFAQQKMDEQAMQLIQDWQLLSAAGVDVNTLIEKMGPNLNTFVQQSIAAGTAIPEAMRPIIEQLIASGQLLDENGNAYTSVEDAGITFAETMDEKFTTLIDKITQMVNALLGIPTDISTNVNVNTNYTQSGNPPPGGGGDNTGGRPGNHYEHNAQGGLVTTPGWSLLGEKGPEAIIPVGELGRMGGGSQADFQNMLFQFGRSQQKAMTTAIRDALLKTRG